MTSVCQYFFFLIKSTTGQLKGEFKIVANPISAKVWLLSSPIVLLTHDHKNIWFYQPKVN